ncbi:hypothetical protein [Neorhizobium galegae]|uniref:hypothetical protein n=1 Tax=Neorhizobium galegae TaxID=399 RepID=UPI000622844F|nr:hypothetical protein [Neorhizobium galegae]CDZ54379.1 Hypothetical protein NGAL_HAMBI2427_56110 [Neorhizobium galegae bv. orientalis]
MSMLSSPSGTSERVWSLVALLRELDGTISRADAAAWLNPEFKKDEQTIGEKPMAFQQVLGAATSMGAVLTVGHELQLNPTCGAETYQAFADWLYDHLIGLAAEEKDAVLLELLAWVACESARRQNHGWLLELNNNEFADKAQKGLPPGADDDGDRRMNSVKVPFWRRWLVFLGLTEEIAVIPQYQVDMARRLRREIARLDIERETSIAAEDFLRTLRQRMPFIDGGRMYSEAAKRINFSPDPFQLSPILSEALRDLHDDGTLELQVLGDMSSNYRLARNATHIVSSFYAVSVRGGA